MARGFQVEGRSLVWRVLIVEDNPADIESIQVNLEKTRDKEGPSFAFVSVGTLQEALAAVDRECFDLVLLDLNLPDTIGGCEGLDGLEALRRVCPDTPVIILTSLDPSWDFIGRAVAGGADDFVNKDELHLRSLARIVGFALDRSHINLLRQQNQRLEAMECAARKAQERAEDESRRKSEFLALMSHEIRTPLNAVLGFAELLARDEEPAADRQFAVEAFRRNGEVLICLLNDILDLAKVESGHLVVERLNFPLMDMLSDVVDLMRPLAMKKGLHLSVAAADVVPERLVSDPNRLRQILVNILGNAIKFTASGFVKIGLEWCQDPKVESKSHLAFHISDSGPGLTQEQQQRLFNCFTQADSSTTREFGGTGLGLELARRLARALGGDVVISHSAIGIGSTFTATVDTGMVLAELSLVPFRAGIRVAAAAAASSGQTAALCGKRILVVDDTVDNLRLIRRVLERAGAMVAVALDGQEGVEMALAEHPDLIFMDMRMPRMDGPAATATLRRCGFTGPIIALTANAMAEEKRLCLAAGCNDFLAKPIDHITIVERVRRLLDAAPVIPVATELSQAQDPSHDEWH